MLTPALSDTFSRLFAELVHGPVPAGGFVLNTGDNGLLRALDALSADDASRAVNGGATIAAHAQHLRYGLSLMNRWAAKGGNPFADARWDEAWAVSGVTEDQWHRIRTGLRSEAAGWTAVLSTPRDVSPIECAGLVASIAHPAYHVGAIRQIHSATRGPRQGTFA